MSRVLIIGASGFIGPYLVNLLLDHSQHQVNGTYNSRKVEDQHCKWYRADLTEEKGLAQVFQTVNPEIVVHLAAMADVGMCEKEYQHSTKVNFLGTRIVTKLCDDYGTRLVFVSTDYVFDGERGNYREDETPAPNTHYGRTKWQAEQVVAGSSNSWSIIRTSLVYGWPTWPDRTNLVTRVIDNLTNGRPAYGYTDQYRSPVYVEDLVQGIAKVMEEDYSGVSHLAGPDWADMGWFVNAVAANFQLNSSLVVRREARAAGSMGSGPSLLGLDSTRSVARLGIQPRDVEAGLSDMKAKRRERP